MDARTEARTYSFTALSTVIHVAMAVTVMTMSIDLPKQPELTEFEFISSSESATTVAVSQAPDIAPEPKAPEARIDEPVLVTEETPAQVSTSDTQKQIDALEEEAAAVLVTPKAEKHAVKAPPKPAQSFSRPPKEIAAVLPVIENTELDESLIQETKTELADSDIDDDLKKVDQEETQKIAALHQELNHEAEQEMKAQEEKLVALQKANLAESDKLAKENSLKRAQEKQALAAAKAAQAELARQQAAESARQAAAAQRAEEARINAEKQAAAEAAIVAAAQAEEQRLAAEKVRSVEELRQMPGNQKPAYDSQDRFHKRQGIVSFMAYVSREGSLIKFKMLQSSGHRELDAKTLKSIKGWRFYPGQEGWVEIPYNWNLKGEPQVMPTTLRRRAQVSQSQ